MQIFVFTRKKLMTMAFVLGLALVLLLIGYLGIQPQPSNTSLPTETLSFAKMSTQKQAGTLYEMDLTLNTNAKKIAGVQHITYRNDENVSLSEVYLHLYPNAFKRKETTPVFDEGHFAQAYPNGFSKGSIDITRAEVSGQNAQFLLQGESDDILKIVLSQNLRPGESIEMQLQYEIVIPNSLNRFGYGDLCYTLGNFYPIVCVYDEKGWRKDPYYAMGDPFYSDMADYHVKITLPTGITVAHSGNLRGKTQAGNQTTWEIEADKVRDFAFSAGNSWQVYQEKVGNQTIYVYADNVVGGKNALTYAANALREFEAYIGEYPYEQFSVVQSDFCIGGMEYPNLVLVDKQFFSEKGLMYLEFVIAHETAHQWFYQLVGNNEIDEAWLDEALTQYTTLYYYEQRYDKKTSDGIWQRFIIDGYEGYAKKVKGVIPRMDLPAYQYDDVTAYDAVIYDRGALMFRQLREQIGATPFKQALQEYVARMKYKNAKKKDLVHAFRAYENMDAFFESWISGKAKYS